MIQVFSSSCRRRSLSALRALAATCLLALIGSPASPGSLEWTSSGPEGGAITAVAFDPVAPATAYAGTRRTGLFKSSDAGASWSKLSDPLLPDGVDKLAVAADGTVYVLAGFGETGVLKSTNGGATWSSVHTIAADSIATDPTAAETVYLGKFEAILKTTDAGANWTTFTAGLVDVHVQAIAIHPSTPTQLYIGSLGEGVHESSDGGASWTESGAGAEFDTVLALAIDPVTPSTIYAGTLFEGIQKSTDSAASWSDANVGLALSAITGLVLDPGAPANLWVAQSGKVSRSSDSAASWSPASGVPNAEVVGIALKPGSSSELLAASYRGILVSTDAGANWSDQSSGLRALSVDTTLATPSGSPALFAVSSESGLFRSDDEGASWQDSQSGIDNRRVSGMAIAPSLPPRLYAGSPNAVWTSVDGGTSWTDPVVDPGDLIPPTPSFSAIAIDPVDPSTVFAGTPVLPGRIYRTADGGLSWDFVFRLVELGSFRDFDLRAIAIDPNDSGHVLAAYFVETLLGDMLFKVVESTNALAEPPGDATWTEVLSGTARTDLSLAFDPHVAGQAYVVNSDDLGFEAFKSTDGGTTWSPFTIGAPCVQTILPDPAVSGTLWVGCEAVYTSDDGGASWVMFDDTGLPSGVGGIRSLALTAAMPPSLHAATHVGVYDYAFASLHDLSVTKDDGATEKSPGDPVAYSIVVANAGPEDAVGATVGDVLPAELTACTWTCVPTGAATCTAGPVAGDIADVVDVPVGETLTYTLVCTVDPGATGSVTNTATVTAGAGFADPSPGNDQGADTDVVLTVGACGEFEDRHLSSQTVLTTEVFEACNSITAGPAFAIGPTGDVTFRAGSFFAFADDFSVESGATFTALIETP